VGWDQDIRHIGPAEPCADDAGGDAHVRRIPVQARSEARIEAILDTTAAIIARAGLDEVTTTLVAREAGMSVGALYRYFPDRQGLIMALARRNLDRYLTQVGTAVNRSDVRSWIDALDCGLDVFLRMHAKEPGFTRLRFGGWIEKQILGGTTQTNDLLADGFATLFVDRFGLPSTPDLVFHVAIATDIADALLTRAFAETTDGSPPDAKLIAECRRIIHEYLRDRIEPRSVAHRARA
jgi:AcrR family transcriptional regulator